jgi:hypothetical protein
MTAAIFGLVGVIVGGLLNGSVTYLLDKKKRKTNAKVAARLLHSEIQSNQICSRLSLDHRTWSHIRVGLTNEVWLEKRDALAEGLHDPDWIRLDAYYSVVLTMLPMKKFDLAEADLDFGREAVERLLRRGDNAVSATLKLAGQIIPSAQAD